MFKELGEFIDNVGRATGYAVKRLLSDTEPCYEDTPGCSDEDLPKGLKEELEKWNDEVNKEEFLETISKNNRSNTSNSDEFLDEMGGCLPEDLRNALDNDDILTEEEVPVGVLLPEEIMQELEKHSDKRY